MNYLAHLYLARESEEGMLGALLGDFVKAGLDDAYAGAVRREILIHRKVDIFTDAHPVVVDAKRGFGEGRRRFAGILLDVYYDHLLAKDWPSWCEEPLGDFIARFYGVLRRHCEMLPPSLTSLVPRMVEQDWLGSYRTFSGFETAVVRISRRLKRNGHLLRDGLPDLRARESLLASGFERFFPDLIRFTQNQRADMLPWEGQSLV